MQARCDFRYPAYALAEMFQLQNASTMNPPSLVVIFFKILNSLYILLKSKTDEEWWSQKTPRASFQVDSCDMDEQVSVEK